MQLSTALALSYIPILAGEVGLALLESLYSKQHREQHTADVTAQLHVQLQEKDAQIAALTAKFEHAQQQLAALDLHHKVALPEQILQAMADKLPQLIVANGHLPGVNGIASTPEVPQRSGDLDAANDIRAAQKQQRKTAIPAILAQAKKALSTSELAQALQVSYGYEVSSDSVRRYCQELMEEKVLESVNRKWQLITS
jgi:DNA-binding NarL/FixJ family response regulator